MEESPPESVSTDVERSPKVNEAAVANTMVLAGAFVGGEPGFTQRNRCKARVKLPRRRGNAHSQARLSTTVS
jgi:hypothetical protein